MCSSYLGLICQLGVTVVKSVIIRVFQGNLAPGLSSPKDGPERKVFKE